MGVTERSEGWAQYRCHRYCSDVLRSRLVVTCADCSGDCSLAWPLLCNSTWRIHRERNRRPMRSPSSANVLNPTMEVGTVQESVTDEQSDLVHLESDQRPLWIFVLCESECECGPGIERFRHEFLRIKVRIHNNSWKKSEKECQCIGFPHTGAVSGVNALNAPDCLLQSLVIRTTH